MLEVIVLCLCARQLCCFCGVRACSLSHPTARLTPGKLFAKFLQLAVARPGPPADSDSQPSCCHFSLKIKHDGRWPGRPGLSLRSQGGPDSV